MISDLDTLIGGAERDCDVCVIGAGAAGITLALNLASAGHRVVLTEAGGRDWTERSQDCYQGEVTGDPYFGLDDCRLRYLGGTTNHWSGWCRTFEPGDFDRSDIAPEHKWPISKSDIDPYLAEAARLLQITPDFDDGPIEGPGIKGISFRFSPPTRFGEIYLNDLEKSADIDLILNANFVAVDAGNDAVAAALFRSYSGNGLTVRARHYVLAMGGIENSRILLWLREQSARGLLDPRLPIGKYWMEHPHFSVGTALVRTEVTDRWAFATSKEMQKREGIFGCGIRVDDVSRTDTAALLDDLQATAPRYGAQMAQMVSEERAVGAQLNAAWEQEPVPTNAVELSQRETDTFGIPRVVLNWKKSARDRRTITRSVDAFNQWLMQNDLGRIRLNDWLLSDGAYPDDGEIGGNHHMGGTRMGTDRTVSVVDANCRVHGTANLYVAGSSVYTTSGYNNPTLPIVQLALRLANHLA